MSDVTPAPEVARTFLVHLNVPLPTDAPPAEDREFATRLLDEVQGALAVGTDEAHTPLLAACGEIVAVDGEEV